MNPLLRLTLLVIALSLHAAHADPANIEGRWLSGDGDGWIRIRLDGEDAVGKIDGSTDPNDPRIHDDVNPDPALRKRELYGLVIMSGFEYDGDGKWSGGTIYDPNSGKTYKCTLRLIDPNTLKVRGYIGMSLFGRNDTWTRDEDAAD